MVVLLFEVKNSDISQNILFARQVGFYIFRSLELREPHCSEKGIFILCYYYNNIETEFVAEVRTIC